MSAFPWAQHPGQVDFSLLYQQRLPLLRRAYERFRKAPPASFSHFCQAEQDWLEEYALFMAIKAQFGNGLGPVWRRNKISTVFYSMNFTANGMRCAHMPGKRALK